MIDSPYLTSLVLASLGRGNLEAACSPGEAAHTLSIGLWALRSSTRADWLFLPPFIGAHFLRQKPDIGHQPHACGSTQRLQAGRYFLRGSRVSPFPRITRLSTIMHTKLSSLLKLIGLSAESPPQQAMLTLPRILQVAFSYFTKNPGQTCLCGNLGSGFIHALNLPKLPKVSVFRIKEFHFSGQLSILSSVLLSKQMLSFYLCIFSYRTLPPQTHCAGDWTQIFGHTRQGLCSLNYTAQPIPVAMNRFSGRYYASREPHSVHQRMIA